jgi:hypothetical protein
MNYFLMTTTLKIVTACSYGLFFSLLAFITFSQVMKDKKVTTNTLLGAICVYLLFGVIWTMLYHVLEITMPGSFIVSNEDVSRIISSPFTFFAGSSHRTALYSDSCCPSRGTPYRTCRGKRVTLFWILPACPACRQAGFEFRAFRLGRTSLRLANLIFLLRI